MQALSITIRDHLFGARGKDAIPDIIDGQYEEILDCSSIIAGALGEERLAGRLDTASEVLAIPAMFSDVVRVMYDVKQFGSNLLGCNCASIPGTVWESSRNVASLGDNLVTVINFAEDSGVKGLPEASPMLGSRCSLYVKTYDVIESLFAVNGTYEEIPKNLQDKQIIRNKCTLTKNALEFIKAIFISLGVVVNTSAILTISVVQLVCSVGDFWFAQEMKHIATEGQATGT